ncbi:MAG: hypothetical protein ACOCUI_00265 [bacterium]
MGYLIKSNGDNICPHCGYTLFNENFILKEMLDAFNKLNNIECPLCKKEIQIK